MNLIRLLYLRWRVQFLAAQWEHAAQLSETYKGEADLIYREMKKAQRQVFMLQPAKEITQ